MAIAKVEPLTRARALRGPFDYRLPERLRGIEVGSVLVVPFGRRRVLGVVVELAQHSELPPGRLAEPVEALEAGATPELVRLGLWVAHAYCSTPARGLELVLPPGTGSAGGQVRARREATAAANAAGRAALAGGEALGRRQREALLLLGETDRELGAGELAAAGIRSDTLRRLARRGLIERGEREVRRRPRSAPLGAARGGVELDQRQRRAVERIVGALDGDGAELLLSGVTGSGKTEVYLAAAEAALERGRGAIVLVPEIALTPQAVGRFEARFADRVAVLHSRLGAGERRDEWERVRRGEARICVGPRSAVFAPIPGLGLVVVDEEHDPSYKQEGDPRYDARAVARRRARDCNAVLVSGSATPRPESWLALERLELPERADGRALPPVEILDMRALQGPLHERTREAFARLRAERGKAIVLLNRRGWAPHLACRSCGHAWGCPQCDVSLVLHRKASSLRCHHCGHAEALADACPRCGSVSLARAGLGTERVEALLAEELAPLPVFRLDSDTAAAAGAHVDILGRFQAAASGVLVGTQMVAKGHDFPDVVLAVVLDADATLRFPDFRAEERTFALVAQLAGRSGRGDAGGRVLVQTLAPEAAAIRHAAEHDTAGFLTAELARRRELGYPPFSELVAIDLAGADEARLRDAATRLREAIEAGLPDDAVALGPAPRFRRRGRERRRILVKARAREPAVAAVRDAVEAAARARRLRELAVSVDVDPQ
ncbi:MAG: replication restart helicase PriA [Solirubrobacterales bacterium]